MRTPGQGVLAFAAILAVCVAGVMQASWWAAVVGGCVLALVSFANHGETYRALSGATSAGVLVFSSIFNATLVAGAALATGRAIGWAWGVM